MAITQRGRLDLLKEVYKNQQTEGKFTHETLNCNDKNSLLKYTAYLYLEDHGWLAINEVNQSEYVVRITGKGIDIVEKRAKKKLLKVFLNWAVVGYTLFVIWFLIRLFQFGEISNGDNSFIALVGFLFTMLGTLIAVNDRE
ncbi:hypothetical protein [Brevibacillus parabrevis]|uniref:hypothetical protein n=1 Tax=Brevibacillus parabrevis TaxID=54914 RepID=UPI0028D8379C|nr:hypothetical protein [Brevibacillus parabrevis]MED1724153.1 hypothetical protein [Brevibacillus parabrevis]